MLSMEQITAAALATPDSLVERWATRINQQRGKTVESIIETGNLLIRAKDELDQPGAWGQMFTDHRPGMSQATAEKYMASARHPVLGNSEHVQILPSSWGTLYQLSRLPEERLQTALLDGTVRPDMKRKDVEAILVDQEMKQQLSTCFGCAAKY